MQETEDLTPEDRSETPGREFGPISKEEIEVKFESYISSLEEKDDSRLGGKYTVDKEKLFAIAYSPDKTRAHRTYFNYHYGSTEIKDEEVVFNKVATAGLSREQAIFTKIGRLPTFSETEFLGFINPMKPDEERFGLHYGLANIKGNTPEFGERGSNLLVIYDLDGSLKRVGIDHEDKAGKDTKYYIGDKSVSAGLVGLEEAARRHGFIDNLSLKVRVEFNEDGTAFKLLVPDLSGRPNYEVLIPKKVNIDNIMLETGAPNLMKDPLQPSKGIIGEGNGDVDWRYKNFSDLTGIHVKPINTDESLPGPK